MPRRYVGLTLVAAAAALLTACSTGAAAHNASAPTHDQVPSASPSASPTPSPTATLTPTLPPKAPPPGGATKPAKPPKSPKPHSTAATGSVTAASLNVAGAGTLMIPAWPNKPGFRWRGPDGSQGSTGTSSVALTFDDGPGPYTSQVLDLLDKYHVKATFCLIGKQIHDYRAVVKRMINDGMTLCDHTWDHNESIGKHTAPYIAANLQRMINAVHAIDPRAQVTYYRNPGGNFTPGTVRVSELLGMRPLYWSEDTEDWTRPGVAAIEHSLLTKTHRDSVVLMHDAGGDRSETLAALRALLPQLATKYHLIALPAARTVRVNPGNPKAPPISPPADPAMTPSAPPSTDPRG